MSMPAWVAQSFPGGKGSSDENRIESINSGDQRLLVDGGKPGVGGLFAFKNPREVLQFRVAGFPFETELDDGARPRGIDHILAAARVA